MPLLHDPPAVLFICLLGTALGRRLLRILRAPLPTVSRLERGVLCAAMGLGMLQYLAFGLGSAHALTPRNLTVGLAILSLLLLPDIGKVLRAIYRAVRETGTRNVPVWRRQPQGVAPTPTAPGNSDVNALNRLG